MSKIDVAVTSSPKEERGKRWVEVPEKDLFDFPFPHIRINLLDFGPGRHYLDADLADSVEERLRQKQYDDLRVMRPSQDVRSQQAMNRYGSGARSGSSVDPSAF